MRAFLAVLPSEPVAEAVAAEIERLRGLSRAVAWVPRPNLHVTLRFLGEQTADRLREVTGALEGRATTSAPFCLTLHGLGAFPSLERPRILWVGATGGATAIRALHGLVEGAVESCGLGREPRPWHPHLTIGRVLDQRRRGREVGPVLREAVREAAGRSFGVVPVRVISLMHSHLSPGGARYRELARIPLGGPVPAGPESPGFRGRGEQVLDAPPCCDNRGNRRPGGE